MSTINNPLASFLDNKISLELPLKYPEVYRVTYTPDFPGPLVSFSLYHLSHICTNRSLLDN